jgi:GNAT superfamily N-acetyltransferase
MTRIEQISLGELNDFIHSTHYQRLPVIPISLQRGLSYIKNPRARGSEAVMFLAYEGERLVGYRVTLPDTIFVDGKEEPMGWYSCVWVDPSMRGKGVAKAMVEKTLEAWSSRILLQNPVPASEALYRGSRLFPRDNYLMGFRGYFRPEFTRILGEKGGLMGRLKPTWRLVDALARPVNAARLSLGKHRFTPDSDRFQVIPEFEETDNDFIQSLDDKDLSRKRARDLNWWINHPWVLTGPQPDRTSSRYFFSALDQRFEFVPVRFYDEGGRLNGLILFSIRDKELRTAYCRLEKADLGQVRKVVLALMYQLGLATFTTFNAELLKLFSADNSGFMFTKSIRRLYLVSEVFDNQKVNIESMRFQDGDGDAAFT